MKNNKYASQVSRESKHSPGSPEKAKIQSFVEKKINRTRGDSINSRVSIGDSTGRSKHGANFGVTAGSGTFGDSLGVQDFGTFKRMPMSAADQKDKIMNIERENYTLKEKENFLRQEIVMMNTKLRRVQGLMNSRSRANEDLGGEYDITDMQRDLKHECDELRDQNAAVKERNRKLDVVVRGLTKQLEAGPMQRSGLAKNDKYAHVAGKLDSTHNKVTKRYQEAAKDLRAQIMISQRQELQLNKQLDGEMSAHGAKMGRAGQDQIRQEVLDMHKQIREIEADMERMQGDFANNEEAFKTSKDYVTSVKQQLRQAEQTNEELKQKNFRLQLEAQTLADVQRDLEDTADQRDTLERQIKTLTTEPFLRKEDENSIKVRIEDLRVRLAEKEGTARKLKDEESKAIAENQQKEIEMHRLTGEKTQIEGTHKAVLDEFQTRQANKKGPNGQDTVQELMKLDAGKYTTLMTDLAMGAPAQGAAPIWSTLPFLERPEDELTGDPKKSLKKEIDMLRQEKSEFAAELEKAQNLLQLQTDIEKENSVYYEHEEKRLKLIEKSITMKVEELSRRADEKTRSVKDLQRKTAIDMRESAGDLARASLISADADARSEFSAATQESEVANDENILDFKVEDADFDPQAIAAIPSVMMSADEVQRKFISVVTVDFYNHSTETTQMSEGLRANYQTQFSFVNKVDSFYVNFLKKNSLKLDVYVSKNNAAIQVGRAEILLKELIESEVVSASLNSKTPVVQRWARVYPIAYPSNQDGPSGGVLSDQMRPLGTIKYKMRFRKPIQHAWRHFSEQAEVQNIEKHVQLDPKLGSVKPEKKIVTIKVVGGKELKPRYGLTGNESPFFFYQFYTFDDRYSKTAAGLNPNFNDTYSYEMMFDARAIDYFERELLEIFIFDDAAPIAGVGFDQNASGADNDDMIGVCRVSLKELATGVCSLHQTYDVMRLDSHQTVGKLQVDIDVRSLESTRDESLFLKTATDLLNRKAFEKDIIMQISRKLAPLNCEIDLMFGIFSQGQRNCTKEDFKHTCLHRLKLERDGKLTERHLNEFLESNDVLRDSNLIEKSDFVTIFNDSIVQARNERLNQLSYDEMQAKSMMQDSIGKQSSQFDRVMDRTVDMDSILQQEIYEIFVNALRNGTHIGMRVEAGKVARNNRVPSSQLQTILSSHGGIEGSDSHKIIKFLEEGSDYHKMIDLQKLDHVLENARRQAIDQSAAFRALAAAMQKNAQLVVQRFEREDYNKDGLLNIDGFNSTLLIAEIGLGKQDLDECFYLSCNLESMIAYRRWFLNMFPDLKGYFTINATPRDTSVRNEESMDNLINIETSMNERSTHRSGLDNATQRAKCAAAKHKIEQFMIASEYSISMMFAIMDTNSDNEISFQEFLAKLRGMHIDLTQDEAQALFNLIDKDRSGSIDFNELVDEFVAVNNEQFVKKMKKLLINARFEPEMLFRKHLGSYKNQDRLSHLEFKKLLIELNDKLLPQEIFHLTKHFDRGNKSHISRDDFLYVLETEYQEKKMFDLSIEDVVKPMSTLIREFGKNLSDIFDKIDTSRDGMVSAEELATHLSQVIGMKLLPEDVQMIKNYFYAKTRQDKISRTAFIELFNREFERNVSESDAQKALADVRNRVEDLRHDQNRLEKFLQQYNTQKSKSINIANFKIAIHSLKCLDQYALDNLTKFMDSNNDGFVKIAIFSSKVFNVNQMGASMRGTMKWSR